jgi:hypothetical protein
MVLNTVQTHRRGSKTGLGRFEMIVIIVIVGVVVVVVVEKTEKT